MPGQPGLTKTVYDPSSNSTPSYDEFNSDDIDEQSLATTFEVTERWETLTDEDMDNSLFYEDFDDSVAITKTNYLQVLDGWFKAPDTGSYTFMITCDDTCRLEFDASNHYGSGSSPSLSTIVESTSYGYLRNYNVRSGNNNQVSETRISSSAQSLVGGRYYRIRGQHKQSSGDAHFTVAVKISGVSTSGHPNAVGEIQSFEID